MGGLGPGIGGFEILVIGLIALIVVGPKDLPVLMKRVGQFMAKMRGMANEFRASFDEMARQSELDDLRKEVEALRSGQGMYNLGADAEAAFTQALNRDPDQLGARYFLGEAAMRRGDAARARQVWTPLIAALAPDDPRRLDLEQRLAAAPSGRGAP